MALRAEYMTMASWDEAGTRGPILHRDRAKPRLAGRSGEALGSWRTVSCPG